jgi:hypothetical protein
MAGDPRLTARPGHAACTASPETYRNPAHGSFRHAVNGTRFGPEHPNIPSREVSRSLAQHCERQSKGAVALCEAVAGWIRSPWSDQIATASSVKAATTRSIVGSSTPSS